MTTPGIDRNGASSASASAALPRNATATDANALPRITSGISGKGGNWYVWYQIDSSSGADAVTSRKVAEHLAHLLDGPQQPTAVHRRRGVQPQLHPA